MRIQVKPTVRVWRPRCQALGQPFDDIALEEALLLREGIAEEVIIVGIFDLTAICATASQGVIAPSVHARCHSAAHGPRSLLKLVEKGSRASHPGKQAIDDDANQTGQMLAALWDRPQATFAGKVRSQTAGDDHARNRLAWKP